MPKSKSAKYAEKYLRERSLYESHRFSGNIPSFVHFARQATEHFFLSFFYFSLDDDVFSDRVLKGKTDFGGRFITNEPILPQLVDITHISPKGYLLESMSYDSMMNLATSLTVLDRKNTPPPTSKDVSFLCGHLAQLSEVFNSFSFQVGDVQKNLKKALTECRRITEVGYYRAKENLQWIQSSVEDTKNVIDYHCNRIKRQCINDPDLKQKLIKQLHTIQDSFASEVQKAAIAIEEKRAATDKYNITLFGRTNVGKSTLREILTNGTGSSIGKGGQRTTKSVQRYEWKGLTIFDVPGFDASGDEGRTDEKAAESAANFADQILFMITSGQPENIEAHWLVKLKKKDKPIRCICNVKKTVAKERLLNRFLENPEDVLGRERVSEATNEFKNFVRQELPNEEIPIIVTHLQTRFLANSEADSEKRKKLIEASRFDDVERAILSDVINHGILYRKRCYLSILDVPVFNQMDSMFLFSAEWFHYRIMISEKSMGLDNWSKKYMKDELIKLESMIITSFSKIKRSVSAFVDENIEKKDFAEKWARFVDDQGLGDSVDAFITDSYTRALNHINGVFQDLGKELNFSSSSFEDSIHTGGKIVDWGKGFGWGSGILTVISGILWFVPGAQVVASVLFVMSLLSGGIGAIWKSREKRLKEAFSNRQSLVLI